MKEKKSFAWWLGRIAANLVGTCIMCCVMSLVIAATYKFIHWILGWII